MISSCFGKPKGWSADLLQHKKDAEYATHHPEEITATFEYTIEDIHTKTN